MTRLKVAVLIWTVLGTIGFLLLAGPVVACEQTEAEWYNPTGWEGCEAWGVGRASRWPGPGVATNDCVYPWKDCVPRRVTSLETGRSVVVVPTMFCDCYHGTADEKLIDLDPATVRALGLDWAQGVYWVRVEPQGAQRLPDTATGGHR
jgi:hypothetical protein